MPRFSLSTLFVSNVEIRGEPSVAFPPHVFTQHEAGKRLQIENSVTWKLLKSPHIQTRRLYLPDASDNAGKETSTTQPPAADRHKLFLQGVRDIGVRAVKDVFRRQHVDPQTVDILATVTSTGLPLPGLSAMIMKELSSFRPDTQRMDFVGMGCNGGLSGLRSLTMALSHLASARRKRCTGMLLCCEINSAFFLNKDTVGHGVVNSLFGDCAVALLVEANPPSLEIQPISRTKVTPFSGSYHDDILDPTETPVVKETNLTPRISLVDFESHTVPEFFDDMVYNVDEDSQLMYFQLSKRIPAAMGHSACVPVRALLERHGLDSKQVDHWVVHGGGAKVIQLFAENLGLDPKTDLRHTKSVLRDFGNVSSASFLVSLWRLYQEDSEDRVLRAGDIVVFVAMGPGATIEVSLGVVSS